MSASAIYVLCSSENRTAFLDDASSALEPALAEHLEQDEQRVIDCCRAYGEVTSGAAMEATCELEAVCAPGETDGSFFAYEVQME